MSSSSEVAPLLPLPTPELRSGEWTRFGGSAVLGDAVTEETLNALAESTRTAARSQGYAVGWAEGQRAARAAAALDAAELAAARRAEDEHRAAEFAAALTALQNAAADLRAETHRAAEQLAERSCDLAFALTEAVVGSQLPELDPVRRALDLIPDDEVTRLVLHPADAAAITPEAAAELAGLGIRVATDPALDRGDAFAEGDQHVLDLRIGAALGRVREVLR